ncbi:unnamed protein product [Pedinophyceae sp. YPF-701]|nr:unnamed protein product [Pedinophyceae sp. YPF-701]
MGQLARPAPVAAARPVPTPGSGPARAASVAAAPPGRDNAERGGAPHTPATGATAMPTLPPEDLRGDAGDASSLMRHPASFSDRLRIHRGRARHWVMPVSDRAPPREYQVALVREALFQNTLVCLPTGLGKTHVAAAVMYNFYRWFPGGKVVFLAPTKPLVAQQMQACRASTGIPESAMRELTGAVSKSERVQLWRSSRVLFLTPQTFDNDCECAVCPTDEVVCVVVDECHRCTTAKAPGVKGLGQLLRFNPKVRVLGLTATPGDTHAAVRAVISHLRISRVEFRSEGDADVRQYFHEKSHEKVVVEDTDQRGPLKALLGRVVARQCQAFNRDAGTELFADLGPDGGGAVPQCNISRVKRSMDGAELPPVERARLERRLGGIRALCNAYDILGSFSFGQALKALESGVHGSAVRTELGRDADYQEVHRALSELTLSNADIPKGRVLIEVLLEHLATHRAAGDVPNRALVFTSFRESVAELCALLEREGRGVLLPQGFIGQGDGSARLAQKGMSRAEQAAALDAFRAGRCNVLVATCVAEEGLDIPNVDLVVCYDTASSGTRRAQRAGRTGRHAAGRVVYLLSQDEAAALDSMSEVDAHVAAMLRDPEAAFAGVLFDRAPGMVPRELRDAMQGAFVRVSGVGGAAGAVAGTGVVVGGEVAREEGGRGRQGGKRRAGGGKCRLSAEEEAALTRQYGLGLADRQRAWPRAQLETYIDRQLGAGAVAVSIGHSRKTHTFLALLQGNATGGGCTFAAAGTAGTFAERMASLPVRSRIAQLGRVLAADAPPPAQPSSDGAQSSDGDAPTGADTMAQDIGGGRSDLSEYPGTQSESPPPSPPHQPFDFLHIPADMPMLGASQDVGFADDYYESPPPVADPHLPPEALPAVPSPARAGTAAQPDNINVVGTRAAAEEPVAASAPGGAVEASQHPAPLPRTQPTPDGGTPVPSLCASGGRAPMTFLELMRASQASLQRTSQSLGSVDAPTHTPAPRPRSLAPVDQNAPPGPDDEQPGQKRARPSQNITLW